MNHPVPPPTYLPLNDYRPQPQVVLPAHQRLMAKFPAVDAHTHPGRWLSDWVGEPGRWLVEDVDRWIEKMAAFNVHGFVNLDGRWGTELRENLERFDYAFPGHFATFAHLNWSVLEEGAGADVLVSQLVEAARMGAAGIKIWKDLGLSIRDSDGVLVLPDDPRLTPVWEAAAELELPIWWHIADPVAFFEPVDQRNENYEMLIERPDWSFHGSGRPTFARLMEALEHVVAAHPAVTFVAVHAGCYAENLGWVGRMLDSYPNLNIDIAARLAQLGRQPRATRELILRHPHRVLFGADEIPASGESYPTHFRFLETEDEYFPHSAENPQLMGRWMISGIDLPDDVLQAVYSQNVLRLIPRLASRQSANG